MATLYISRDGNWGQAGDDLILIEESKLSKEMLELLYDDPEQAFIELESGKL